MNVRGNRTAQTVTSGMAPNVSTPTDAASNHMTGETYDANGNLTVEPAPISKTYKYDA